MPSATAGDCQTTAHREAALGLAKGSRCPRDHWHAAIEARLARGEMTMMVVGANKGYGVLELLERYTATNVTGRAWQQALLRTSHGCGRCCGICDDCRARLNRGASTLAQRTQASVRVHAFEILPANVAMMRAVVAHFGLPVEVHETAASNSSRPMELSGHFLWRSALSWGPNPRTSTAEGCVCYSRVRASRCVRLQSARIRVRHAPILGHGRARGARRGAAAAGAHPPRRAGGGDDARRLPGAARHH